MSSDSSVSLERAAEARPWHILRLITVNVDGLGAYRLSPVQRIHKILDVLLEQAPDVMLFQEVLTMMYEEIKNRLSTWRVYRRREQAEDYFLVTAVRIPAAASDKCTSFTFPTSRN